MLTESFCDCLFLSGTLELKLNKMFKPTKKAKNCTLDMLQLPGDDVTDPAVAKKKKTGPSAELLSLFEQRRIRGFWPCYSEENGERVLTV